jgi:hypothetical protein
MENNVTRIGDGRIVVNGCTYVTETSSRVMSGADFLKYGNPVEKITSLKEENKLLRETLEKIKAKSVYDANHDNIMYNYQEVHKIAKDTLTQLSTTKWKRK